LEKIINTLQGRKKSPTRLTKNSKLFKVIINAIREKKGENIISLDMRKIDEAVADFFIVCEAQSNIQINAIAGSIEELVRNECEEQPYHIEKSDTWTLVDYINIVVHVFKKDSRKFYDLENLWADAVSTEHND
jgi:ribosome-associated protein